MAQVAPYAQPPCSVGAPSQTTDENRFGSLPSCTSHTSKIIHPMTGISHNRTNQPLWSVSCNRRTPTARPGKNTAREKRPPAVSLIMPVAADARTTNRNHHQYSERVAHPSNVAYLEKQMLMDSPNVMMPPLEWFCLEKMRRQHSAESGCAWLAIKRQPIVESDRQLGMV